MGLDLETLTVRVLDQGLPSIPDDLPPDGSTVAVARTVWQSFGAVLFVRRRTDGQWECETALTALAPAGTWEPPGRFGGGPWPRTGLRRPAGGRVEWIGRHGETLDGRLVVAHRGVVASQVARLRVEQDGRAREEPVRSEVGAVLVLAHADSELTAAAIAEDGAVLGEETLYSRPARPMALCPDCGSEMEAGTRGDEQPARGISVVTVWSCPVCGLGGHPGRG